ncbi:MAG: rod shape-determining protein MreC [Proteobacteria bacterium]|nr:rod shape-determining protein MreC [Pseudomonadota bacterium]
MSAKTIHTLTPKEHWQFVAACVFSLTLMVVDEQTNVMAQVRMALSMLVQPLENIARLPESWLAQSNSAFTEKAALVTEVDRLRTQVLLLNNERQQNEKIAQENERLRMLLGVASRIQQGKLLVSLIVDHSPNPFKQILRLNKGSQDKVRVGLPVMDAHGLMGQILSTNLNESDLLLITDVEMQIPVRIVRTGARAILQGDGSNELTLKFLPTTADIREGDMLETSGIDGRYPSGLPVAEVVSVKSQSGAIFWQVVAQPNAKLSTSREVLILLTPNEKKDTVDP